MNTQQLPPLPPSPLPPYQQPNIILNDDINTVTTTLPPLPQSPFPSTSPSSITTTNTLTDHNTLFLQNQKLQEQLAQQTLAFHQFKEQSSQTAANQLQDRLNKVIALLLRYTSNLDHVVPQNTPHFLRSAIDSFRALHMDLVNENKSLSLKLGQITIDCNQLKQENESQATQITHLQSQLSQVSTQLTTVASNHELMTEAQMSETNRLNQELETADHQLHSLHDQLESQTTELQTLRSQLTNYESQILQTQAHCAQAVDDAQDECLHWKKEAERVADEACRLQDALEDATSTARADTEMRNAQFQRRMDALKKTLEAANSELDAKNLRVKDLESMLVDKSNTNRELQSQVHSLTHQVQHKLFELAQSKAVDRALVANLVIQFVTQPPIRRWEILTPLAAMLDFTPEQRFAVGLDKASSIQPGDPKSPGFHPPDNNHLIIGSADSDAVLRRATVASIPLTPANANPSGSVSSSTGDGMKYDQSLSDKFISFLLRESTVNGQPAPPPE